MKSIGSKAFGFLVIALLAALLYITVFSEGLGQAPALQIKTGNNETLALDRPMKPVLVNFWATSCPGCIAEMPELANIKRKFGDKFELVAISMDYDPTEQVKKFIAQNNYPFSFVMDTDGKMAEAFGGVLLTPTSFLIAPNGNIIYQKVGEVDFALVSERIQNMTPDL